MAGYQTGESPSNAGRRTNTHPTHTKKIMKITATYVARRILVHH